MRNMGDLIDCMTRDLTEDEIDALCDRLIEFIQERDLARADPVAAE